MKARTFQTVDMTVGAPWKQILKFTIPMLLGNVIQQLYSAVDSAVVGRFVGDNALAAIGSATPIINLLLVLFVGVGMGATIVVSQQLGARNREGLSWTIGNCMILIFITAAIMTAVGLAIARPILTVLGTPESILDWSTGYLMVTFAGSIGLGMFNILSGVLRGLGDAVSALIYLVVASVLNIVLDFVFVAGLGMSVNGAALATIIAQGLSAFLCVIRLRNMQDMFDFGSAYFKWKKQYAGSIIRLGVPSGVTQAIISMSLVLVQSLTNSFGEQVIAANVILQRVDGFAMQPALTFSIAMTTYAGQNVGARNEERVHRGCRQGMLLGIITAGIITTVLLTFGKYLMGIFTETALIVDMGMGFLRILAFGYIALAVINILTGVMRGAGDTLTPMWLSIVTMVSRAVLAYIMVGLSRTAENPLGEPKLLYWSLLLSWIGGVIINIIFYRLGRWRKSMQKIAGSTE